MKVLKGILSESKSYYLEARAKAVRLLARLPVGVIKKRKIAGKLYYYQQWRSGPKVIHKYLGKEFPDKLDARIKERRALKAELKKINEALKILKRAEGRKNG